MTASFLFAIITIPLVVVVSILRPEFGDGLLRGAWRTIGALARRRRLTVASVALLSLLLHIVIGYFVQWPVPVVHDEFAYLLGADTFAAGRLTNPTHPMWEHFESYHIIHHPTYQSKYPPGQSLFLALGQAAFGHPIWGVWLSLALACGAVTWMLQAWVPPRWALVGGLVTVFNPFLAVDWGQGYWGGGVAMLGGACLFGALTRVVRDIRLSDGLVFGIGLVVLALSRPFEGLLASIPVALIVLAWMVGRFRSRAVRPVLRFVLPASAVLLVSACCLGLYHKRVTGSPFRMPYQTWSSQHAGGSALFPAAVSLASLPSQGTGQRLFVPEEAMQHNLNVIETRRQWVRNVGRKFVILWVFHLGVLAPLVLFAVPRIKHVGWELFATASVVFVTAAVAFESTIGNPHYAAPVTALFAYLLISGMRVGSACVRRWRVSHRIFVAVASIWMIAGAIGIVLLPTERMNSDLGRAASERARILAELRASAVDDLVIVRYGDRHVYLEEWVYNEADIDHAKVVWARDLGPEKNAALISVFSERTVWLLEPDTDGGPRLSPYPMEGSVSETADPENCKSEDPTAPDRR